MTERRWRVRVLFTFRGRPKTPITDAAPGTLAISTQLRRSCRPVWANDALDHACDSRAAGCPDEEWEQDATMKATLHERDADHDELLRRVQVQPDDVADQRRPQALEFLRRDRRVPGIQPYLVQNLGIHWTPSGPATDLEVGVLDHLAPLGDPARQPAQGEQHGEHPGREAHRLVDQAAVKVDVRVQLALDEVPVRERYLLQFEGDVEQGVAVAEALQELVGGLLDDRRARVVVLVDPVPEAHELGPALLALDLTHELVDVAAVGLDLLEHVEHSLVGATMQRPEQRVDPGRDRGEQVGVRRAHHAHRRGGTVLLMVSVQDQQLSSALTMIGSTSYGSVSYT